MTFCGWRILAKKKKRDGKGKQTSKRCEDDLDSKFAVTPPVSPPFLPSKTGKESAKNCVSDVPEPKESKERDNPGEEKEEKAESGDEQIEDVANGAKIVSPSKEIEKEDDLSLGNPRNKCALKPGHSLMDWIRLGSSGVDLAGTKGVVTPVSHAELQKHGKRTDAWLAIRRKVYNVTQYMDFHPGGVDELMKGVGKDATKIFNEVHAWVNYEQLLNKCYIGPLRTMAMIDLSELSGSQPKLTATGGNLSNNGFRLPFSISASNFMTTTATPAMDGGGKDKPISDSMTLLTDTTSPSLLLAKEEPETRAEKMDIVPRFDWIQKTTEFTLIFYTKALSNPGLLVEHLNDLELEVRVIIDNVTHLFDFKLAQKVQWPCSVRNVIETGKLELSFTKCEPQLWTNFGSVERKKIVDLEIKENEFDVINRSVLSHDSISLVLRPLGKIYQIHPIGHHVSITGRVKGHDITRSYTPVPHSYLPNPCPSSCITLLLKVYQDGMLSKHMARTNPLANALRITPPKGNFSLVKLKTHMKIGLLAAGSGITPFLYIIDYLLTKSSNQLELLSLYYFNKSEEDIWCRQKLEALSGRDERFQVRHVLSDAGEEWTGSRGRISADLISALTSPFAQDFVTFSCICGPPDFNEAVVRMLEEADRLPIEYHCFQG